MMMITDFVYKIQKPFRGGAVVEKKTPRKHFTPEKSRKLHSQLFSVSVTLPDHLTEPQGTMPAKSAVWQFFKKIVIQRMCDRPFAPYGAQELIQARRVDT